MARKTKLDLIREAIEIQGHLILKVGGETRQVRKITVVDGEWVTDIPTRDMCGYVRVAKSKDYLVYQAERVIADADQIRAEREAANKRATEFAMGN